MISILKIDRVLQPKRNHVVDQYLVFGSTFSVREHLDRTTTPM